MQSYEYDVALSYASEDEGLVRMVYKLLSAEGFKVFFAPEYQANLIKEDLTQELYMIYQYESKLVAAFVSRYYVAKERTMHESYAALARKEKCLIPFYLDGTILPNLDPDITYSNERHPVKIATLIKEIILNTTNSNKKINGQETQSLRKAHGEFNDFGNNANNSNINNFGNNANNSNMNNCGNHITYNIKN